MNAVQSRRIINFLIHSVSLNGIVFRFFEGVKIYILKQKFNKGNWNIGLIHCSVQERPRNISVRVLLCVGSRGVGLM